MKALKNYPKRIFNNATVLEEEKTGYAREFTQHHRTYIRNPEIRRQIMKASFLEIIG